MMFHGVDTDTLRSVELAAQVNQLKELTRGGYDILENNETVLAGRLEKVLRFSKQEKEWYVYFRALYEMMFMYEHNFNLRMVVKYAELYYKESNLYLENILPAYQNTNLAKINSWIYKVIFDAYALYHQIDDDKMDIFMKRYEEIVLKYGGAYCYYKNEMEMAVLYRDAALAEHGRKHFEEYEEEAEGCYVCEHLPYFGYYLLTDKLQKAEEQLLTFIHRQIPQKKLWCYNYCQRAQTEVLYGYMLQDCLRVGKPEYFRYFFQKYWVTLPMEVQHQNDWTMTCFLCAVAGNFSELDRDLRVAEGDADSKTQGKESTVDNMQYALCWWCYFALLDKSGVHEVETRLPEPENNGSAEPGEGNGKVSCLVLSKYFENIADDYGTKFAAARKKFDYLFMKDSYRACAGL